MHHVIKLLLLFTYEMCTSDLLCQLYQVPQNWGKYNYWGVFLEFENT